MAREQSTIGNLQSLSKIAINFGGDVEASLVRDFLAVIDTAKLQHAKVACLFQDHSERNGSSFSGLGHVLKWLPRGLTRLSLCQIRFTDLGSWQLSDYQNLTHLELKDCRHSGWVLKDAAMPRLQHFVVRFTELSLQGDLDHCIAFIERADGLRCLIINNRLTNGPLMGIASALDGHQGGLQALLVDGDAGSALEIRQMLLWSGCHELRQLGLRISDESETTTLWQTICVSTLKNPSKLIGLADTQRTCSPTCVTWKSSTCSLMSPKSLDFGVEEKATKCKSLLTESSPTFRAYTL